MSNGVRAISPWQRKTWEVQFRTVCLLMRDDMMNAVLRERLSALRSRLDDFDMYLGPAVRSQDLVTLNAAARDWFGAEIPRGYAEFLRTHDGFVAAGVFLYSSRARPFPDSEGHSPAFLEQNRIAREVDCMNNVLVFGDSDQDYYVLDLSSKTYQVRDRQAFDNVYEEYSTFDEMLAHVITVVEQLS